MTPERHCWWNSLPKEERKAREQIKFLQENIKICKTRFDFIWYEFEDTAIQQKHISFTREEICRNKYLIKALRKEIAMDVIALHNSAYEYYTCPYCGQNVREGTGMRDEDRYCASCGQKLRWE